MARTLSAARFVCASAVRLVSAARTSVVSLHGQVGQAKASDSHVLGLVLRPMEYLNTKIINRFKCPPAERFP